MPKTRVSMRVAAVSVYAVIILGTVVLLNAGIGVGVLVWSVASLCLGWTTRSPWLAFLPFLAGPIAAPFGYPDEWVGRTPLPLWFAVLWVGVFQAAFVIVGIRTRHLYERFHVSHR